MDKVLVVAPQIRSSTIYKTAQLNIFFFDNFLYFLKGPFQKVSLETQQPQKK
jgi:hypothetical protein